MSQTAPPPKVCSLCRRDCGDRPRSKDRQGRYICGDCLEKKQRAAGAPPAVAPHADAPGDMPPADDGMIPIAIDPADNAAASDNIPEPRCCGNCGRIMHREAVICTGCGFNTQTGLVLGTQKKAAAGRVCLKCGYPLEGLKSPRCPECGTLNTQADRRKADADKDARAVVRNAYLQPVIMFVVGLTTAVLLHMVLANNFTAAGDLITSYLLGYVIYVPISVLIFLTCCLFWIGFDAPVHLIALRLAAVFAVTDAVGVAGSIIPVMMVRHVIVFITFVGLLQSLLDLDLQDAAIVGILIFFIRLFVIIAIVTSA